MRTERVWQLALAAFVALAVIARMQAADMPPTKITIPDMECKHCAKKVATTLTTVAGVAVVETNVPSRTAVVRPKPQTVVSPRALWEALEKVGKEPSKLEGPSGTFTSKPQS
ncbi:MAG: heavy-metal-associated domain-containing protein [Gemmataceae bacterium]|nr:heavy-metal-associated domain-containing protein [Gemmataceae bacterium]